MTAHYVLLFNLVQHHKYSLTELESLIPWELEVYVEQFREWVRQYNEEIAKRNGQIF